MAFVPRINVTQSSCNKITLTEETNPYSSLTNTTGWGTPNIDTDDVTLATVNIYPYTSSTTPNAVSTNGTIIGTLFTDTTHTSGIFAIGQLLTGTGVAPGTRIVALITGTGTNNGGTYIVNISQSVSATTINGYTIADSIIIKNNTTDLYTNTINEPTPSTFVLLQDVNWVNPDGIYRIEYLVATNTTNYQNPTQYSLFLCNLCACKDNLIQDLIKSCSTENTRKLKEQVDQMEIFIYGIQSAFACKNFSAVSTLLTNATAYCATISNCGCGCGGC